MENRVTMIKSFLTEIEANEYAKANCGRIEISYDYDDIAHRIIKVFLVKIVY